MPWGSESDHQYPSANDHPVPGGRAAGFGPSRAEGFVPGTVLYDQALKAAGVSSTFHLFETGGHGYGLRPSANEVSK